MRLRQATAEDDEFCFRLNVATMREYVEPMYGWDEEIQRRYHDEWFASDRLSIIEDDAGKAIGVVEVSDEGDHLYLSRIAVLPEVQGHGFGTTVIRDLIARGRMLRLHVFTNNIRARRLYERLGFVLDQDAEREGRVSMHHPAEPAAGSGSVLRRSSDEEAD